MDRSVGFTEDRAQIISLWHSVFGDTEEDIVFFLDNCLHKRCLGSFFGGRLVSMLFLVDCEYCGRKGKYVYAVCTSQAYRNKGLCSELIHKVKSFGYDFLWLIPANDELFGYYAKFGFKKKLFSSEKYDHCVSFFESREITDYLYDGSDYEYPAGMIFSEYDLPCGGTGYKRK